MGLKAAVSRVKTVIEDHILTAPSGSFTPVFHCDDDAKAEAAAKQMDETAAFDAGPFIPLATCQAIRAEMDRAFAGLRPEIRTKHNQRTGIQHVLNPERLHPAVLEYATHPFLLSVVERFLRRRIYLADFDMRRVPPMSMGEVDERAGTKELGYTSSHWHRDIRGHQVKIMIYLTDVGENDNNFAFLPGTHKGFQHRPTRVEESRFTDEYVANHPVPIVECYGPAGTTLVFDTNPIHRLRRKAGASVRDTMTFYYTPGQELRFVDIEEATLSAMEPNVRALFGGDRSMRNE